MPRVGFELTVPVSARAKTVHALDFSATVTGDKNYLQKIINCINKSYLIRKYLFLVKYEWEDTVKKMYYEIIYLSYKALSHSMNKYIFITRDKDWEP
jgi:hypothetical protein